MKFTFYGTKELIEEFNEEVIVLLRENKEEETILVDITCERVEDTSEIVVELTSKEENIDLDIKSKFVPSGENGYKGILIRETSLYSESDTCSSYYDEDEQCDSGIYTPIVYIYYDGEKVFCLYGTEYKFKHIKHETFTLINKIISEGEELKLKFEDYLGEDCALLSIDHANTLINNMSQNGILKLEVDLKL